MFENGSKVFVLTCRSEVLADIEDRTTSFQGDATMVDGVALAVVISD